MKRTRWIAAILCFLMMFSFNGLTAFAAVKTPSAPKLTASAQTVSTVTLKISKVKNATGYTLYSYNKSKKKYKKLVSTKKLKYQVKKLKAGTTYYYAVKAYIKKGKKTVYSKYSKLITTTTLPDKPASLTAANVNTSTVSLKWSKVKNASKYTVKYSTDKTFKSGVKSKSVSTNSVKIGSLALRKTYYFRVYAIKTLNKKNYSSAYSSVKIKVVSTLNSEINIATKYQTIDGFGASAAWWAHKVGGWETADDIIKYLYDKNDGIGLNIYRYNIGTDSWNDEHIANQWQRTQGFITDVGLFSLQYDWSRDANAQNAMKIARKYAGDNMRVTLFANSPPTQLTKNGFAYVDHNENWHVNDKWCNLDAKKYAIYATFLTDVADHFTAEGYRVTDVSPMNEPQYDWCADTNGNMNQEGCHYSPWQAKDLLVKCVNAAKNKPYKISMFESGAAEPEKDENGNETLFTYYLNAIMGDSTNAGYFDSVSLHSYWANKAGKQGCRAFLDKQYPGMKVACTEYCQMTNDKNTGVFDISSPIEWWDYTRNGMTIEYGVQMARTVYEDLTCLNATEWNWWLGVSNGYYPDGLVYIDNKDEDHSVIETSKRLWCLGNYSKFIREGAVRVKTTEWQKEILSSAYLNKDGSLVVVYVNQTDANKKVNIDINGYKNYAVYETSADKDLAQTAGGSYAYLNNISLPSQSVVSVILTN